MQRIRMNADAPPQLIVHGETMEVLGVFLPGLGYWITEENGACAHAMVREGYAKYEVADDAPLYSGGSIDLRAPEGKVSGFMEVKD